MSREIELRAWDKKQNRWVEGLIYVLHTSGGLINVPPHIVLTQSTGLRDRHGKKVFEGDIVRARNLYASTDHLFEVFWREKFAGFFLKELNAVDEQHAWIDLMHGGNVTSLEVVGNIWED